MRDILYNSKCRSFEFPCHPLDFMPSHHFKLSALKIKPLSERQHNLTVDCIQELQSQSSSLVKKFQLVAQKIVQSKRNGCANILMMGAHVIRSGVQRYLIDLMARGYLTCLAMNGSGIIHDYEFARIGATTEGVARYIKTGEFGFWKETGEINDIVNRGYSANSEMGLGEAVGQAIENSDYPHKEISLLASAVRCGVDATIHVCIGQDIIHQHPNFDGAATGKLSHNDFLKFAGWMEKLEGGVIMNFGSAVMAPEVFLKGLSMARNLSLQAGRNIRDFTTCVCDLHDLPDTYHQEAPKDSAAYFFRPWKTMLVRTVAEGGRSYYVKGFHGETIPALWEAINIAESEAPGHLNKN